MKKLIIALFLFIFFLHSKSGTAQPGYPDTLKVLPDTPRVGDTIRVALHTYLNTQEPIAWIDSKVTPGKIDIQGCFPLSTLGPGSYYSDTIMIGPLSAGNYLLSYTYHNSPYKDTCVVLFSNDTTFFFEVFPPTGIQRPIPGIAINIYPNPVTEILHIHTDKSLEVHRVSISDIQGRQVMEFPNSEDGTLDLDVSLLPHGMYIIHLNTDKGQATHKFFKESTD